MRNLRTVFLFGIALSISFGVVGQPCDKEVSTNPLNPVNEPMSTAYPNLTNPWLNSFDISAAQNGNPPVAKDIQLNNNVGWQIPYWDQNLPLDMKNPYTTSGTVQDRYNYLRRSNIPFLDHDFHWKDGWELLYLGTGYYPNAEGIDVSNLERIIQSGTNTPDNPQVPYIVLYNRYRGTMRVFMNLFAPFGSYDNVRIILSFDDNAEISGLFRHLEVMDRPLDQPTNIKQVESFNPNSGGTNRWFSADFQMGYDPCDCNSFKELRFDLIGIDTLNINLYARALSTEIPLMDDEGQPDYDNDWLSVHDVNGGISGGNRIYTKFDGLIDDYKSDLTRYEQLSADYADYQSRKAILDAAKGFVVDGLNGLIPASGSFVNFFLKATDDDNGSSDFAKFIKGSSKGLLGYGYDQVSASILKGSSEPQPPTMPVASYNEMRFVGNVVSNLPAVSVGPFYIPGAYDESGNSGNLNAFNYPAYNVSMGLVALLNTPSAKIEFSQHGSSTSIEDNGSGDGCIYDRDIFVKNNFELRVKLDEELNITLNNSLDFDFDRTQSYGGIEVEIKVANNDFAEFNNFIGNTVNNSEQNIYLNLDYTIDGDRIIRLNSKWVPLELLNQYVFSLKRGDIYQFKEIFHEPPVGTTNCDEFDPPNYQAFDYDYEIISVKLKLIHDMYFDQIGSSGEQVNTTQVFSYFLYNPDENINLFGLTPNNWDQFYPGAMDQYTPGVLTIDTQTIGPSNPIVSEVNGSEIYIRAEEVKIIGDIDIQTGYNMNIEALTKIDVVPGAILNPKLHLKIRRDFYALPEFQIADDTEISSFCQSSDYHANVASKGLRKRILSQEVASTEKAAKYLDLGSNSISIHPNPANSQIRIISSSKPISEIQIFDLSGRSLIQKQTGNDIQQVEMNIDQLQSGVYIVQTLCGDERNSEKLVVSK